MTTKNNKRIFTSRTLPYFMVFLLLGTVMGTTLVTSYIMSSDNIWLDRGDGTVVLVDDTNNVLIGDNRTTTYKFEVNGTSYFNDTVEVAGNILPDGDFNLGNPGLCWNYLFVNNITSCDDELNINSDTIINGNLTVTNNINLNNLSLENISVNNITEFTPGYGIHLINDTYISTDLDVGNRLDVGGDIVVVDDVFCDVAYTRMVGINESVYHRGDPDTFMHYNNNEIYFTAEGNKTLQITSYLVEIWHNLTVYGNITANENITAQYFIGNGSLLTGIVDNDTTYTNGTGLNLSGTIFSFNTTWGDSRYTLTNHWNRSGTTLYTAVDGDKVIINNSINATSANFSGDIDMSSNDIQNMNTINFTDDAASYFGNDPIYPGYWGAGNRMGAFWLPQETDLAYYIGYGNTTEIPLYIGNNANVPIYHFVNGSTRDYFVQKQEGKKELTWEFFPSDGREDSIFNFKQAKGAIGGIKDIILHFNSSSKTEFNTGNFTYDGSEDVFVVDDAGLSVTGVTNTGGGLVLPTTIPASPVAGDIWLNTTTNLIGTYNGTSWYYR